MRTIAVKNKFEMSSFGPDFSAVGAIVTDVFAAEGHQRPRFPHSHLRSDPSLSHPDGMSRDDWTAYDPRPRLSETHCMDCISECRQPSCPAMERTEQCTDQCVVIPCHDLSHVDLPCEDIDWEQDCDSACEGVPDCSGCTGYEDLVRFTVSIIFDQCR